MRKITYDDLNAKGKALADELRDVANRVGNGFIENLKTPNYREVIDSVDDLESMNEEDFAALINVRCRYLEGFEIDAVRRIIEKKETVTR
jgi:hypothetical protein